MNQEFLTKIPSEITINILSRLPVRTLVTCKCVCKPWLQLLETREFAKAPLSKSAPGLVVFLSIRYLKRKEGDAKGDSDLLKTFEFKDELDDLEHHELRYNPVTEFDLRAFIRPSDSCIALQGSADGLILLRAINSWPTALYVCNPITRESIELPSPDDSEYYYPTIVTYGFGVSKMTRQHKVVRVYHECIRNPQTHALLSIPNSVCKVYTLGTGCWRSIAHGNSLAYSCRSIGAFLNGNLHWLVSDLKGSRWISCFDLEMETFSAFSPPLVLPGRERLLEGLVALGDCLCICDNTSEDEIVIWSMKEYGNEKSWTKEFVISKIPDFAGESYEVVYPIKVFEDGDILMIWDDLYLFYYSNKTKTAAKIDMWGLKNAGRMDAMLHTSTSFMSLKSLVMENVKSSE